MTGTSTSSTPGRPTWAPWCTRTLTGGTTLPEARSQPPRAAAADPVATARAIRSSGARASIAVKPGTPVEPYLETLDEFDMILVMTVEPGFGGQSFQADTMPKLARAREAVRASGLDVWLEVDGGIDTETIVTAVAAGADTVVAGSAVYGGDPAERIAALRAAAATVALSS